MIPILYEADEKDFTHNGLGKLTDLLEYTVDEVLNGQFDLFLEYPVKGRLYSNIKDSMLIKAKPNRKDENHLFRIYEHEMNIETQTIMIYARSNTFDLAGNMVADVNLKDVTPQQALDSLKSNLIEPSDFTFFSDMTTKSSTHWERRNALSCIAGEEGSLIQYWGGEIKRGNKKIWLYNRRGNDNVTTIRYGKNLAGLTATYSIKGLVTAILPFVTVRKEDNEEETIIGNVVKSQYVNKFPVVYYEAVEFTEDDGVTDKVTLDKVAATYFKDNVGRDVPSINMEIKLVDLSHTNNYSLFKGLEEVEIGDTITVYAKQFGVNLAAKVTRVIYNGLIDENVELEIGTSRYSSYDDYKDYVDNSIKPVDDRINIIQNAANGKNKIFRGPNMPTKGMIKGDLWYKPVGDGEYEMYIYDGEMWELIISTGVNKEIQDKIDAAEDLANDAKDKTNELEMDANSILAGLGVPTVGATHLDIVQKVKKEVGGRMDSIVNQVGNKADFNYVDSKITSSETTTNLRLESYVGERGIITGKVNDIKITADGNQQLISNIKRFPSSEIVGYQSIKQTSELYERVIGSTEGTVKNNVARMVMADNIFRTEISNELTKTSSSVTQLQSSWAVALKNGTDIVTAINATPSGVYLAGKKIVLDGETIVRGTFTVTDAMLANGISANKITTGTLNAANVNLINMNASNIATGILSGIEITSPFNYQYSTTLRNTGTTKIKDGTLSFNGAFSGGSGGTYMYINPDTIYAENLNGLGVVRSVFKLNGDGLQVVKDGKEAFFKQDGIYFDKVGSASMKYSSGDARIRIGSYNGVDLGTIDGSHQSKFAVGGGKDGIESFVNAYVPFTAREGIDVFGKTIKNAYTVTDLKTMLFAGSSNRIVQVSDGSMNILAPVQLNLGWTNGSSAFTTMIVTQNQIVAKKNLNMDGNSVVGQSDIRLKKNVVDSEIDGIALTKKQRFIKFEWDEKHPYNKQKPKGEQFGLEAQYAGFMAIEDMDSHYLSIDLNKQVNLNTLTNQQLIKRLEDLEAEVNSRKEESA